MPAWNRRDVKDKSNNTLIGRIYYSASNQAAYRAFKTTANVPRVNKFGFRRTNHGGGAVKELYASAKLRRRRPGATRQALNAFAVFNTLFNPNPNNKSHLIPDVFGGPNNNNLINEHRSVNLSGHKPIENRIDSFIEAGRLGGNDTNATRTRGGLVVRETFDNAGVPRERVYFASIIDRNTNTRSYHKFTFKRI
ncbi:MAG TPA: hypothetical protein VIM98_06075 [Dyella sp.]|uniref:hypothetical protein n=1 Tax=Dyella sp. TaxID=1869338 RepID=UPI002F92D3D0